MTPDTPRCFGRRWWWHRCQAALGCGQRRLADCCLRRTLAQAAAQAGWT